MCRLQQSFALSYTLPLRYDGDPSERFPEWLWLCSVSCLQDREAVSRLVLAKAFGQSLPSLELAMPEKEENSCLWH